MSKIFFVALFGLTLIISHAQGHHQSEDTCAHGYVQKILSKDEEIVEKTPQGSLFVFAKRERPEWIYSQQKCLPKMLKNTNKTRYWHRFKLNNQPLQIAQDYKIGGTNDTPKLINCKNTINLPAKLNGFLLSEHQNLDLNGKRIALMFSGYERRANPTNVYEPPHEKHFYRLATFLEATGKYDHVMLYSYNTFPHLRGAGNILGQEIAALAMAGADLDIITYCMGGIVARYAIESKVYKDYPNIKNKIKNLVTFASPHAGIPAGNIMNTWAALTQKERPCHRNFYIPVTSPYFDVRMSKAKKERYENILDELNFFEGDSKNIPTKYHFLCTDNADVYNKNSMLPTKRGFFARTAHWVMEYAFSDSRGWQAHDGRVPCYSQIGLLLLNSKTKTKEQYNIFDRITAEQPEVYRAHLGHWTIFPEIFLHGNTMEKKNVRDLLLRFDNSISETKKENKLVFLKKKTKSMLKDPARQVTISLDYIISQFAE